MTRLQYFDQEQADMDDFLLKQAIADGRVPATCLLGGVMVQEAARAEKDPCQICPCPRRDKCGGRGQTEYLESVAVTGEARGMFNSESNARKMERRSHARELIRAGLKAKGVKSGG